MSNWGGTYAITAGATGTLTSADATHASNSGATWPTGAQGLTNFYIRLLTGVGSPATVQITANTSTQVTVSSWPSGTPNNATTYEIVNILNDQDHITAATSFSTNIISEIADSATIMVDGLYILTITNSCTLRWAKTLSTIATFCANNRTVQGKAGFWSYVTLTSSLSIKPYMSYIKFQDCVDGPVIVPTTAVGDNTTIHHLWFESVSASPGYMAGAAVPAGVQMVLSSVFVKNSKHIWTFSTSPSTGSQIFDTCWINQDCIPGTSTLSFAANGAAVQWIRHSVFGSMSSSDVSVTSAGKEHRVSSCYFAAYNGSLALGCAGATDVGIHSYFLNVAKTAQQTYGTATTGTGTLRSASNDISAHYLQNSVPGINITGASAYSTATSDNDYLAGNNYASIENIDTSMSTSSTSAPQQYLNLTATRTNARSSLNFPLTINNIQVGTPSSTGVTITFDCASGAAASQQTTVNADSSSGQPVLSVAATSMFLVGMRVEIGYNTARSETGRIASISAGVSITLDANLTYSHTAAQADVVSQLLRNEGLPFVLYGTASGNYTMSTPLPKPEDWGLFYTGLRTAYQGKSYTWARTGHSVSLDHLEPGTTYFVTPYAYTPIGDLVAGTEVSFITSGVPVSTGGGIFTFVQ